MLLPVCLVIYFLGVHGSGQVVSYEATSLFPEDTGPWERTPVCDPDRFLNSGWLVQHVEVGCGGPPGGDADRYIRSLEEFSGEDKFFFEWKLITTGNRSEIPGVAPAAFATGDLFGVSYHFTIARDQVRLIRDNRLPIIYVEVEPEIPHTYRLELFGDQLYVWYIDGQIVDSGTPEGAYPTPTAVLAWRAKAWFQDSITQWDYIRYGRIPKDASGDYDSDDDVDLTDYYYVHECFSNSGPGVDAGPGCRFADFDGDKDVDLKDLAEFQNRFTGEDG